MLFPTQSCQFWDTAHLGKLVTLVMLIHLGKLVMLRLAHLGKLVMLRRISSGRRRASTSRRRRRMLDSTVLKKETMLPYGCPGVPSTM